MLKKIELQSDIIKGIQKIMPFNESNRLEVHKIYGDIYDKYLTLPREEFSNEYSYNKYMVFVLASKEINDREIKNLLNKNI